MKAEIYFNGVSFLHEDEQENEIRFSDEFNGCIVMMAGISQVAEPISAARIGVNGVPEFKEVREGEYDVRIILNDGKEIKCGKVHIRRDEKNGKLKWNVSERDARDKLEELIGAADSMQAEIEMLRKIVHEIEKQNKKLNGGYHIV